MQTIEIRIEIMMACQAALSAPFLSPLPSLPDMTADAPTPIPAPNPFSIQYIGQIVATAELASTPSPEHQEASAKLLIWTTAYETARGTDIASRALLGSPSIVSRSFSAVALICWDMEVR